MPHAEQIERLIERIDKLITLLEEPPLAANIEKGLHPKPISLYGRLYNVAKAMSIGDSYVVDNDSQRQTLMRTLNKLYEEEEVDDRRQTVARSARLEDGRWRVWRVRPGAHRSEEA